MSNTILVIGAGVYQECGIRKLKEKGYTVVAVDAEANCIGSKIADIFFCVDINDTQSIINSLKENNIQISSAMCFSTEIALRSVAYINNYFSLPGLSMHDVLIATDKSKQRAIIVENNLPCPWYYELSFNDFSNNFLPEIPSFPLIIKPTDNAGSRGVSLIKNKTELLEKIDFSFSQSKYDSKIIIEEFIPGIEFTVEALINNNEVHILGISEKKKPVNNYTVSVELFYNSPFVEQLRAEIEKTVTKFLKSCNFSNTITHTEVIYSFSDNKIYIVESTVRSGGFYIFDKILPYITNQDIIGLTIDVLLHKNIQIPTISKKYCILGFYYGNIGKITNITILDTYLPQTDNFEYGLFVKPGDEVLNLETDGSRLGYFVSYGESWEEVFCNARISEYCIKFEII